MKSKKRRLKKIVLHPLTAILILIVLVILLSAILSLIGVSATTSSINIATNTIVKETVTVTNILSYDGIKFIISNAAKTFVSFSALSTLLITLIGISIVEFSGLANAFLKKTVLRLNPNFVTFLLILVAIFSSIVNEVGYAIMIPIGAIIFLLNGRNPLAGICVAYAGVAFGYGISFFTGATEIALVPYTKVAAQLVDTTFHVSLTSNLFIMITSCIVLAIVGTIVTERFVVRKIGRYFSKTRDDLGQTKEIEYLDLKYEEQKKIVEEVNEKKGLKNALIAGIIVIAIFIYMIIPGLPLSGLLLDTNAFGYVNQLFGDNSYFQDGFTYMVAIFFIITGISYGIGSKTIKSDKDVVEGLTNNLANIGIIIVLIFFASQFIAIFKQTNIGVVITSGLVNLIDSLPLSGIVLIVISILVIAISGFLVPSLTTKWAIMSPILVPTLMKQGISPQFTQFIFRAADSMIKGLTPLLAFFIIYIAYLNLYNKDKDRPIGIMRGISYMIPYAIAFAIAWLTIIIGWYIIGIPIGPNVYPTI